MAQIFSNVSQSTAEVKTHTFDFNSVLPTGGTVTAGTATHTPPGGGTATTVTCSVTSPYVYATVGPLNTLGVHYVDISATFSDGDIATARLVVDCFYPSTAARSGMVDLLTELRAMAEAGANDYSIANAVYWTDRQLQDICDRHAYKMDGEVLFCNPTRKSGGYQYTDYYVGRKWLEQTTGGTAVFKVLDNGGATVALASYTVDYNIGQVTFVADQGSAVAYMVTCISYDLYAAAAEIWRKKAAHYASAYDFSTDNHNVKRSQLMAQANAMANYYLGMSNDGVFSIPLERPDDTYW